MSRARLLVPLLLAAALPVLPAPAQAADRVSITALPALPGQTSTRVTDVNDLGQVIGASGVSPVLWQRGRVTGLPGTSATAINRRGQVLLLTSQVGGGNYVQQPSIWHNGTTTAIGPAGSGFVVASAINAAGAVPMTYSTSPYGYHQERAALWQGTAADALAVGNSGPHLFSSVITDQGLVAGAYVPMMGGQSYAFRCQGTTCGRLTDPAGTSGSYSVAAANESGVIVGTRDNKTAVRWQGDSVTVLPGDSARVSANKRAVNERGDVVGSTKDSSGVDRATVWRGERQVVIPVAGPATAVAVNDNGDVIVRSTATGQARAFLWRYGRVIDLGTLGGAASEPVSLNNNGTIIGVSTDAEGTYRAVTWTVR